MPVAEAGNPCKVIREIGEHDKMYYYKDREIMAGGLKEDRHAVN